MHTRLLSKVGEMAFKSEIIPKPISEVMEDGEEEDATFCIRDSLLSIMWVYGVSLDVDEAGYVGDDLELEFDHLS